MVGQQSCAAPFGMALADASHPRVDFRTHLDAPSTNPAGRTGGPARGQNKGIRCCHPDRVQGCLEGKPRGMSVRELHHSVS